MVKGVNKQIIEISETDNYSFERAILFVRPESQHLDRNTLHRNAVGFLAKTKLRTNFYFCNKLSHSIFYLL